MQRLSPAGMAEEGPGCPCALPRMSWMSNLRCGLLLLASVALGCLVCSQVFRGHRPERRLEPPGWDVAELQFNHTGPRKELMLLWDAGPALGRSFSHGPELDQGQLRVHRDGIYRLHIQVTLANCSPMFSTKPHNATLAVGICSPITHSISLLRLHFGHGCSVSAQRLTPLARGDVLCTNLTLPLLPSPNTDETFLAFSGFTPDHNSVGLLDFFSIAFFSC